MEGLEWSFSLESSPSASVSASTTVVADASATVVADAEEAQRMEGHDQRLAGGEAPLVRSAQGESYTASVETRDGDG
uniref:Uncharacterized protein n=1 Tax=Oryza punctata TaxID=4537 RepID=A0A0E0LZK3_ORYPU